MTSSFHAVTADPTRACAVCLFDFQANTSSIAHDDPNGKNHPFHTSCFIQWLRMRIDQKLQVTCPSCAVKVSHINGIPVKEIKTSSPEKQQELLQAASFPDKERESMVKQGGHVIMAVLDQLSLDTFQALLQKGPISIKDRTKATRIAAAKKDLKRVAALVNSGEIAPRLQNDLIKKYLNKTALIKSHHLQDLDSCKEDVRLIIEGFLQHGFTKQPQRDFAFRMAALYRELRMVQALFQIGQIEIISLQTALLHAAENAYTDIVEVVLENYQPSSDVLSRAIQLTSICSNLDEASSARLRIIQLLASRELFSIEHRSEAVLHSATVSKSAIFSLLLESGPISDSARRKTVTTIAMASVHPHSLDHDKGGEFAQMLAVLLKTGPISEEDRAIALENVLYPPCFEMIEVLLQSGPISKSGWTAENAANAGRVAMVKKLREISLISDQGWIVKKPILRNDISSATSENPLQNYHHQAVNWAVKKGDVPLLEELLGNQRINSKECAHTVEIAFSNDCNLDIIQALLQDQDVDIEIRKKAVTLAASLKQLDRARQFLQAHPVPESGRNWKAIQQARQFGMNSLAITLICDDVCHLALAAISAFFSEFS